MRLALFLSLFTFFAHVSLVAAADGEDGRPQCMSGDCGVLAGSLLQTKPKEVIEESVSLSEELTSDDDHHTVDSGGAIALYSQNVKDAFSQGGASIQHMDTELDEDTQLLSVKFHHQGKDHKFQVAPHNIYAEGAQVRFGEELLEMKPPRTYRAREHGKWASMTLHEDGSLEGVFQDADRVIEVTPSSHHQEDDAVAALLEIYEGKGQPHLVRWVEMPPFGGSSMLQEDPVVPADGPDGELGHMPVDKSGEGARSEEVVAGRNSWSGTKWAGAGCYTNDQDMHEMLIGIYSDKAALDKTGSQAQLQTKMESAVNQASFVFESQMNIKFKIGDLQMSTSTSKFASCPSTRELNLKLDTLVATAGTLPFMAIRHVFSGCGGAYGVVGLAFVGTICKASHNFGANKIHTGSPWLVFAHEAGHNFGAGHSFEDGQGGTGGIMDYGDGKLSGHYQFNTKYRKGEVCSKLKKYVDQCQGKFQKEGGGTPTPTHPTIAPTEAPTPQGALGWNAISTSKACQTNNEGIVRTSYRYGQTLASCKAACSGTCVAVDFFTNTGWCNFYNKACTKPMRSGSASSYYYKSPSGAPTPRPTAPPTRTPTPRPTAPPTPTPTARPTPRPTAPPTPTPTARPTPTPTAPQTPTPTARPTPTPTAPQTPTPTARPTSTPTPTVQTTTTTRTTTKPGDGNELKKLGEDIDAGFAKLSKELKTGIETINNALR